MSAAQQPHYFDAEARARGSDPAGWYHRITNTTSRTCRSASRTRWSVMRFARCIFIRRWPTSRRRTMTRRCARPASGCGTILPGNVYTSPAAWDRPGPMRVSRETTICPTTPPTPKPVPPSASVYWSHRMLLMTGESRYADVMERALYNGALSGISLHGDRFFYENPAGLARGCRTMDLASLPLLPGEYRASGRIRWRLRGVGRR